MVRREMEGLQVKDRTKRNLHFTGFTSGTKGVVDRLVKERSGSLG